MQKSTFKLRGALSVALTLGGILASSVSQASTYAFRVSVPALKPTPASAPVSPPAGPFNFSTCGATGAVGPTLPQCNTAYAGSYLAGLVTIAPYPGIQKWTVPLTGQYTITAKGAKGASGLAGGYGAVVTATVSLIAGQQLTIAVGQNGSFMSGDANSSDGGGGGGGTFVTFADNTPIVIAGGGGGGSGGNSSFTPNAGRNASTSTCGDSAQGTPQCGGAGGLNGVTNGPASGGGGLTGAGQAGGPGTGGASFITGAAGGLANNGSYTGGNGGFGGGGAAWSNSLVRGGAGGGYSGGQGGGYSASTGVGSGGGSFAAAYATTVSFASNNNGVGSVTITKP